MRSKHPHGITLILALLIMSAVVAIGITVSTIVVQQVKVNKVANYSHQGYYATESGLEQGLNVVNTLKSGTLADALVTLTTDTFLPTGADPSLFPTNYATTTSLLAQSAATSSSTSVPKVLKEHQSVTVELYNVDDSLNLVSNVDFSNASLCVYGTGTGAQRVEVSWVAWDNTLQPSRVQQVYASATALQESGGCTTSDGFAVPLHQFYPGPAPAPLAGYRIRITALAADSGIAGAGDIQEFAVTASPAQNSQILLKSTASIGGNTQALMALFPWSLPLSSLFNFVIFSEKPLTKEHAITVAEDVKTYGSPYAMPADTNDTPVPTTAPNPFDPATCSECSYYVRIYGTSLPALTVTMRNNGVSVGSQTFVARTTFSSCITPLPFGPFVGPATASIQFSSIADLTGYQLLTQPSGKGPEEIICPTAN